MHIVFFGDQHLDSLGGAQVSMRLQREFLERAGHTVTVVAPRMHASRGSATRPGENPAYDDCRGDSELEIFGRYAGHRLLGLDAWTIADLDAYRRAPANQVLRCVECDRILVRTPESGL